MVKEKSEKWKFKIDLQRCLLKAIPQGFSSTALIINANQPHEFISENSGNEIALIPYRSAINGLRRLNNKRITHVNYLKFK
jgi:hypothetical protein